MSTDGLLRRARLHAGLTQNDLAARLDLTDGRVVSDAERKPNPTVGLLARYGAAMGLVLVVRYQAQAEDGTEIIIE